MAGTAIAPEDLSAYYEGSPPCAGDELRMSGAGARPRGYVSPHNFFKRLSRPQPQR